MNTTKNQPICPLDILDAELKARTIMGDAERTAISLWIAHTYVFHRFKDTPRLFLTSLGPGCGKSQVGRLIAKTSNGGKRIQSGASYASIRDFRRNVEDYTTNVTCVIDQLDGMGKTNGDDLRLMNLFCSSTETDAVTTLKEKRIKKDRETFENIEIPIGYPVVLGKIGAMPNDALQSRSITIHMQKETEDERDAQMPARQKDLPELQEVFRQWLVYPNLNDMNKGEWPKLTPTYIKAPKGTESRTEDMWQPLLNIAQHAGGKWPERAREALAELHDDSGPSLTREIALLQLVYDRTRNWKRKDITGPELTQQLGSDCPFDPRNRGRILSAFGIRSRKRDGERFISIGDVELAARRMGLRDKRGQAGQATERGRYMAARDETTKNI